MITSYLRTAKNYVATHQVQLVLLAAPAVKLMRVTLNKHDKFLAQRGYYTW